MPIYAKSVGAPLIPGVSQLYIEFSVVFLQRVKVNPKNYRTHAMFSTQEYLYYNTEYSEVIHIMLLLRG